MKLRNGEDKVRDGLNVDTDLDLVVGEEVSIQLSDPPTKLSDLVRGVWLPVRIIDEYEKFYVCLILPHHNPVLCWGISKPYKICISKTAIRLNEVRIKRC